jgi:hypothetical protein
MKRIALALMIGVTSATNAFSDDSRRPIDEPVCVDIIGRILRIPLVKLDRYEADGGTAVFRHPLTDISLKCGSLYTPPITIVVGWRAGPSPSEPWYTLAMLAGNVATGANPVDIDQDIRDCINTAESDKTAAAVWVVSKATIQCNAFQRDGDGVTVTIGLRQ